MPRRTAKVRPLKQTFVCSILTISDPFEPFARKRSGCHVTSSATTGAQIVFSGDRCKRVERLSRHTSAWKNARSQSRQEVSYDTGRLVWSASSMNNFQASLASLYNQHGGVTKRTNRGIYHANR